MAALTYAGRGRTLAITWGSDRQVTASEPKADISATVASMSPRPDGKLTTTERAARANAALTTEQRQAAGRARAAMLHDPETLAARIGKAWPDLSDEKRRAVRRKLREAGIIQ